MKSRRTCVVIRSLLCAVTVCSAAVAVASNLLTNASFEAPDVGTGNNIGTVPTGWSNNTGLPGGFNLIDDVAPPAAYDGSQFLDLTGGATSISQTFTLATARAVSFGGTFSPRDNAPGGGGGNTGIYDSTNTTLLFSSPVVSATGDTSPWLRSLAISGVLPAGNYTYRANVNDAANIDLAFVDTAQISEASGAGPISPFSPSNTDLLQTNLGSVSSGGDFAQASSGGVPVLTNGAFTISGGNPGNNTQLATAGNDFFVEFNLDTTVNTLGYNISSIATYGGWNDSGRDRQLYNISYSLVGSAAFTGLDSLNYDPIPPGGVPSAIRAVFVTSLSGVDAIRFDFPGGQENGFAGIGEIDVFGVSVPEPTSLLLGGLAALAFAGIARRRRTKV